MTGINNKQWLPGEPAASSDPSNGRRLTGLLSAVKQHLAVRAAVPFRVLFGRPVDGTCGIFAYHRITQRTVGVPRPTYNTTPRRFRRQMQGLLSGGYRPLALRQVLEYNRAGRPFPPRAFAVTFDDGYENVYHHAWPVLKELGIPATIFVATAYLDGNDPFPFDDWSAAGSQRVPCESWKPLSTAQCAEMLDDGLIELGAHTHTHADFSGRPDALRRDLITSLAVLQRRFGVVNATFAFPFGYAGPALARAAKEAGVLCALTTQSELVTPQSDPFDWGRFPVYATDTATTLAARLDGWYSRTCRACEWLYRFLRANRARPHGHIADPTYGSPREAR